jgi:hypothetical protein
LGGQNGGRTQYLADVMHRTGTAQQLDMCIGSEAVRCLGRPTDVVAVQSGADQGTQLRLFDGQTSVWRAEPKALTMLVSQENQIWSGCSSVRGMFWTTDVKSMEI